MSWRFGASEVALDETSRSPNSLGELSEGLRGPARQSRQPCLRSVDDLCYMFEMTSRSTISKITCFDSVWDAIEPSKSEAANMKARADLMIATHKTVLSWNTTQRTAAKRLGLTQPRLNDLLKGRITKFSLDALVNHATLGGLEVKVKVGKKAA
jgi:predicted XRE-type DNA-binding protein